ncbi:MAG TPA: flavodoxin family protein [Spirochaetia bacterium]|nr:flavodoxin family protein [Spirochaetaceae bacterium]HPE90328.1 flavodoxin family protein [Spirochaetales bacterium]HRW25170.1 flavodoxin family protein [Spirochaetia bacterium]
MRALGISASPREHSNSRAYLAFALKELAERGVETEMVDLRGLMIDECQACYSCAKTKECAVKDDFQGVFARMMEADAILVAYPVYHASEPAKLKALMDRAGFLGRWTANDLAAGQGSGGYQWKGTAFSGKIGTPIAVARRAGHAFAFAQTLLWFTVNDFIVTGSHYWNVGVAGKGGAVNPEDDQEAYGILSHQAENIAALLKKLKA